MNIITATCHKYGDNIDTDRIIPGKYTKTLDMNTFKEHVFEDLDPEFRTKFNAGEIVVAGDNFGCGSSREQAPIAIKLVGVSVVVASYFARIFYRNAINIGLPLMEIGAHDIENGDQLVVNIAEGLVVNLTKDKTYTSNKMPQVMIDILAEGGLVNYLTKHGTYQIENDE